jgi:hypothetical protein
MRRTASIVAGLCTVPLMIAACGSGSTDHPAADTSHAAAPTPAVLNVTAGDFTFDAPGQIPAGLTTIRLVNNGKELHHVQLVRLASGKTGADFAAALKQGGPPPSWIAFASGPNAPLPGGGVSQATVMLEPGNYLLLCVIPGADGQPHVAKGMVRPMTVVESRGGVPAAEPASDVSVTLNEYNFVTPTVITAGTHTFRVENQGVQPHEIFLGRLAPGKHAPDLVAWVDKQAGPPPAEPLGGLTGVAPGGHAYFTASLTPGTYAFFCFLPDAKDGAPHVVHGMTKEFTIPGAGPA